MWPVVSRAAIARAAAPGPHPISMTRDSGRSGRASTITDSRGESFFDTQSTVRSADPCSIGRGGRLRTIGARELKQARAMGSPPR